VFLAFGFLTSLEGAHADSAAGVEAEDFEEGIDHRRRRGNDGSAENGHLALVHVAAPDGEAAIDDREDAQDETEHHDYGQTVADAGLQGGGTEGGALRKGGPGVEREQGCNGEERTETVQGSDAVLHIFVVRVSVVCFVWRHTPPITRTVLALLKTVFVQ